MRRRARPSRTPATPTDRSPRPAATDARRASRRRSRTRQRSRDRTPRRSSSATGAVEPELGRDRVRVQRRATTRPARRAERRARGPPVPVAKPVDVAIQRPGVGEQLVGERDRLGVLQVGEARAPAVEVLLRLAAGRVSRSRDAAATSSGVVAQVQPESPWRSGRCGCGRRAACRPARRAARAARARARCARPRRRASGRRNPTRPRRRDRRARRASGQLVVVEQAGRCRIRACAGSAQVVRRQPPVEVHADRQARPARRPGRWRTARPTGGSVPSAGSRHRRSRLAAILLGSPHSSTNPWPGTGRRCLRVVRRQVEVVQRLVAAPAGDDRPATVQRHPDVAGDVRVRLVDEAVERSLQRREPQAVVDELAPALVDGPLEPRQVTLDRDVLQLWCAVISAIAPGAS